MAARGPDWLLGFGFTVKDKHLLTFLEQAETKFESLAKTIKKLNKGSSSKSGGLDMSQFTEAVKPRGRGSLTSGLSGLDKSVSAVFKHVTSGLQHVNDTGRDISISLHRSILTLLDDVEKGSFKASKHLEELPAALMQIPGLSKDAESSLTKLFDDLESGKATHDDLVKTFKGLRKEIKGTVEDSSGVELLADNFERFHDTAVDVFELLRPSSTEEIFQKAGEGIGKILGGLKKSASQRAAEPDVEKKSSSEKRLEKYKETVDQVVNSMRAMGEIDPTQMRNVKRMTTDFSKRFGPTALKLGRWYNRVPLVNKIFGKRRDLTAIRKELGKVTTEMSDWSDFKQFKEDKDKPELSFKDFLEIKKTDVDQALIGAEDAFSTAVEKLQKELAEKGMPAWESIYEPGQHEAAEQAQKIMDWADQAFSPEEINKAIQDSSAGSRFDPLAEIFAPDKATNTGIADAVSSGIEDAVDELVLRLKYDSAPAIADELSSIMNLFTHGRKNISEEAVSLNKTIGDSFKKLKDEYIEPLARNVGDALLNAKGRISEFSAELKKEIEGSVSESFTKLRERINRSARTFGNLTKKSDEAFLNILLSKEEFVQEFEENFDRLADNVGLSVGKISTTTAHEFRQLEEALRTVYSNLSTINAEGVSRQTEAISRGFVDLASTLDRITGPIVKNYEDIGAATRAALMGGVATAAEGVGNAGAVRGGQLKEKTVESSRERAASGISDLMGQMSGQRGEEKEQTVTAARPEPFDNSEAICACVNALGVKLSGQFGKLISAINSMPAKQSVSGKLKIDNDEMKKSVTASIRTKKGLSGGAR